MKDYMTLMASASGDVASPAPYISFVTPAFNEEKSILPCLESIREACLNALSPERGYEIIVTDNNSSDRTGQLATDAGAVVVFEPVNRISIARNAGARHARGEWIIFLDADSILSPGLLADTLEAMDSEEIIGGGALVSFPGQGPFLQQWGTRFWNRLSITLRWAAGSYIYVRTEAFRHVGGFDEEFYYAEELNLSGRLKKLAHRRGQDFVILRNHPVLTSDRKMRQYDLRDWLPLLFRLIITGGRSVKSPKNANVWYDGIR